MANNDLRSLWEQRLAEYESSEKNIKTWCQEKAIKENQFYYWRGKIQGGQTKKKQPAVKWLSLDLHNDKKVPPTPDSIAVHVGQVTIELRKGFDKHLFCEIIQILQEI